MYYGARWYDVALGRFVQADTIIPEQTQGTQAWDRYAYASNNPVKYVDPTGHHPCDGVKSYRCTIWRKENARINLQGELMEKYDVEFEGYWSYNQLQLLSVSLEQAAELVGGIEKFKIELQTSMKNQNAKRDVFTFWMVSDEERKKMCGGIKTGSPCAPASGAVFSPSNFTPSWHPRVPTWATGKPDLIAEIMILHEISHHLISANPAILVAYASPRSSLVTNPTAFEKWPVESLADAIAYYAILDGQSYPGYEDQMDFVRGWQW